MKILKDLLWSERGEIGDAGGDDAAPEQSVGTVETVDNVDHDLTPGSDTEVQPEQTPQGQRDDFLATEENLDPRKLDPALQPIFKRMQGVYTKRMQEIAEIRDRAQQVDRFYNDRNFAQETLVRWAAQNGYQLTPINGQTQGQPRLTPAQQGDTPTFLVEQFKANLQPELQWMAEPLAKAMQASMQGMLQPVLQQHEQQTKQQRASEWDKHANELGEVAPGWEEHEGAMGDLFDFMRSDSLYHPTYGSKIQMLYDLATARAASMKQAQARVASAAKNRVSSSRPSGKPASVEDEILKASNQDAWAIAKRNALAMHKKSTT